MDHGRNRMHLVRGLRANFLSLLPPRLYRLVSANFSTIFLHNYDPGPSCAATLRVYIDPKPSISIPVSGCTLRTGSSRILEYTENGGNLELSFPSSPFFDALYLSLLPRFLFLFAFFPSSEFRLTFRLLSRAFPLNFKEEGV